MLQIHKFNFCVRIVYLFIAFPSQMPWSECDNTFQVLYQIGIGNYPKIDKGCLSAEGINFLSHCFEIDPLKRWTAGQLRDHPFVKVS